MFSGVTGRDDARVLHHENHRPLGRARAMHDALRHDEPLLRRELDAPVLQIDEEAAVDDEEEFMTRYMTFIEQVMTTEPIDIFAWPTFLPVPIARQYTRLWTKPRVTRILDLAKQKKLAIEINELAHVPDETFITQAKQAGLKFTFGTDSRNQHAAHFYYCYQMAQKCRLTQADMWMPRQK